MKSPLADSERDALITAILPDVAFDGWSRAALRAAARRAGIGHAEASALFPRGAPDLVAAFSRWVDRRMLDRIETSPLEGLATGERIGLALRLRFEILAPWREAVRRSLAVLMMPHNALLGGRLLYETVDGIWYAAGDAATDLSFYTKRATLAGIVAAATLYWLDDRSGGSADTEAFIERRLADIGRVARARHRFDTAAGHLPNPFQVLRPGR
ncbi:MAG: COQ9 family protein [Alphaproteobacteria bacterium]|nr:COQ9 family protein [Alphaproteobacteria bacterium]